MCFFSGPFFSLTCTASYQQMPVTFLMSELAFESETQSIDFLTKHRAAIFQNANVPDDQKVLNCKALQVPLAEVFEEKYRKPTIKGAI